MFMHCLLNANLLSYVYSMPEWMYRHHAHSGTPQKSEEVVGFHGTRVTCGTELSDISAGNPNHVRCHLLWSFEVLQKCFENIQPNFYDCDARITL